MTTMTETLPLSSAETLVPLLSVSHITEILATVIFAIAILHTFSVTFFARLAAKHGRHAGLWHWCAEVEAVFGIWAAILIIGIALLNNIDTAIHYLEGQVFTEPLFVFVIMVVAASRPIIYCVIQIVQLLAKILPIHRAVAMYFILLFFVPLSGSFITEPAAMTLAALLFRDTFLKQRGLPPSFLYASVGVLFVNISIGGVLTAYAAPPVLMVANTFNWDSSFMFTHFGLKAIIAVFINATVVTLLFSKVIIRAEAESRSQATEAAPGVHPLLIALYIGVLAAVVLTAHHPVVFLGIFILFLGINTAYDLPPLMIKNGLLVGFFLAGLVVLGKLQTWWLQPLIGDMNPLPLFFGVTTLTAITDNAALTYLGSQIQGVSDAWKYMLVAGAVTGGGLTVIANAPNPAGFAILKDQFPQQSIKPLTLFLAAFGPTVVAAICFLLPI